MIDTATKYWIKRIEALQNNLLRVCLKVRKEDETTDDLRLLCEIPLLATRRKELLTTLFFSLSKKLPPPSINIRTRGDRKIKFPMRRPKNAGYRKTPYYRGVTLWNDTPLNMQASLCKQAFKTALKKKLGTNLKGNRQKLLKYRRGY